MTDQEYIELAAKAAGIEGSWHEQNSAYASPTGWLMPNGHTWNPLSDSGDAFELAVKLGFLVCPGQVYSGVEGFATEKNNGDILAATRLAIVRAAAEIGKGIK